MRITMNQEKLNKNKRIQQVQGTKKVHTQTKFCQIFGQVCGRGFDQGFDQKYNFTVLPGQKIQEHLRKT